MNLDQLSRPGGSRFRVRSVELVVTGPVWRRSGDLFPALAILDRAGAHIVEKSHFCNQ